MVSPTNAQTRNLSHSGSNIIKTFLPQPSPPINPIYPSSYVVPPRPFNQIGAYPGQPVLLSNQNQIDLYNPSITPVVRPMEMIHPNNPLAKNPSDFRLGTD